ncbi:hypothetical protein RUND412_000930 [Rhizina undulata]
MSVPLRPLLRSSFSAIPRTARFSTTALRPVQHPSPALSTGSRFIPRFLNPSLYVGSLKKKKKALAGKEKPKEWNPATFFIVIFLFIGSQAIQLIALKHSHADNMRRADAKIGVLKEVIQRIQNGEEVDVELMLGTGNEKEEKSWEDVMKEIEEEDARWTAKQRKSRRSTIPEETVSGEEKEKEVQVSAATEDLQAPQRLPRQPKSARDYFT